MIKVVDLFCGAGGLTHGLLRSGLPVIAGYDIDASCRYAYEKNNDATFIKKSVADITRDELLHHYKDAAVKILAGCAPCQPFSTYSQKQKEKDQNDKDHRWGLLYCFADQIRNADPDIVTMENVPGLLEQTVFKDFLAFLNEQKYHVWHGIVFCPDYGMAQRRTRLVLIASKLGPISLIEKTHSPENYVKIVNVIGHLPKVKAGSQDSVDPLHKASTLSPLNMARIKASKPGGTWKDWPPGLIANCHKKETGKTYASVYGRMAWNDLASTITTQCTGFGNGRFGHPEQHRAITLREAALLQSFPDNYEFWPPQTPIEMRAVARMIGNAVPVRLGEIVGESINAHLKAHSK